MSVFSDLFKSRYTSSLEDRVRELRNEIDLKNQEIAKLTNLLLLPNVRTALQQHASQPQAVSTPTQAQAARRSEKDLPKVGNWIKSKNALETLSDVKHVAHDPEPEPKPSRRRNSEED